MTRMTLRIAMVSRRVHPAHGPGGLERHVFELVSELARQGVEVQCLEGNTIGAITSGGFGPTVGAPVAMGYVSAGHGEPG